jgi:hypothetical protein
LRSVSACEGCAAHTVKAAATATMNILDMFPPGHRR